jgi:predicted transcriptional regulator
MQKTYREIKKTTYTTVEESVEREVIENYRDVKVPEKHKLNNGDWIVLFQEALLKIAMDEDLSKGSLRVLFYLISKTKLTNEVKLPTKTIATDLNEKFQNVYTSLKGLEERNILIRDKETKLIRLNYELAYKGRFKDFKKFQYKDVPLLSEKVTSKQKSIFDEIDLPNPETEPHRLK